MKKLIIVLILMMISSVFAKLNCYDVSRKTDKETIFNNMGGSWMVVEFNCLDGEDSIKSTFFIKDNKIEIFERSTIKYKGNSSLFYIRKFNSKYGRGFASNTTYDEFGITINKIEAYPTNEDIDKVIINYWNEYKKFLKK